MNNETAKGDPRTDASYTGQIATLRQQVEELANLLQTAMDVAAIEGHPYRKWQDRAWDAIAKARGAA